MDLTLTSLSFRARLYRHVRHFFDMRDVLEVETPILSQGGNTDPNIDSLKLQYGSSGTRWLRTSPEYPLKRLLAAGVGDCYELGKVFRAGEQGRKHNPEFTMLEWYRIGWDYHRLIDEVVELLLSAAKLAGKTPAIAKQSYRELFLRYAGLDPLACDEAQLLQLLGPYRIVSDGLDRDDYLNLALTHHIEPQLQVDRILAVYDYPASQAALAKTRDGLVAERFEVYWGRLELANGYQELTDAREQAARFAADLRKRQARGKELPAIDEGFLRALGDGLPECTGVALGMDRLLMILLDAGSLEEMLPFPFALA